MGKDVQEVVGFAGLGNMGSAMAENIQQYLGMLKPDDAFAPSLYVWNRTSSKADALVDKGATKASSIEELASKCSIVFSMLFNDAALISTFDTFLAASPKPGIWCDCSTIYPGLSAELATKGAAKGISFLSTPIFGRPDAIRMHKGLMVCAGDPAARERVKPLLESIGQGVLDCGDHSSTSSAMKLVGNFFISSWIEVAAEAMTLGEKNGVKREWVVQFVERMFPGVPTKGYTNAIAHDNFMPTPGNPGFALAGGIKDVGHMRRLAQESGAPLPLADIVYQHLNEVKEMGGGDLDWSSLALAVRKEAGLPLSHLG